MTIPEIKLLDNGTIVSKLEVRIDKVYPSKPYQGQYKPTTIQNIEVVDVAGNKLRCSVWGHDDLKTIEGKDVVIHTSIGKKGEEGVKVKHGTYQKKPTVELTITDKGQFQLVSVYQNANPSHSKAVPERSDAKPVAIQQESQTRPVMLRNGQTVGMAIKEANVALANAGLDYQHVTFWDQLHYAASQIMHVAERLEHGDLAPRYVEPVRGGKDSRVANTTQYNPAGGGEDMPF